MSYSSRRKFIKSATLATAAAGIIPAVSIAINGSANDDTNVKALTFLFQGDSITDGNRGRNTDPNHIMGHGYAYGVASRVGADFPTAGFSFYNRGISGNTVTDLEKRWQTDTLDLKPDVLSVLIGINDAAATVEKNPNAGTISQYEAVYRKLLQDSKAANSDIILVLGLPFVYAVGKRKENWTAWQDATLERAEVVKKLATEFDAIHVDYPAVFDKATGKAPIDYWIWDGIHPTVFGHELMTREWIKQVGQRLKFLHKKYRC